MADSEKQERLQHKIQKSFIKKYAIIVGIGVLLVLAWFLLYFQPVQNKLSRYSHDITEWMQKIRMATVSKKTLTNLEKNVMSLKDDLTEIERRIYHVDKIPNIAEHLIRYASNRGLKVQSMTPNYDVLFPVDQVDKQGKPLVKLPLEIKMIGRYRAGGRFIEEVNRLPFIFSPDELIMQADAQFYPKLHVTVRGFLFLLDEEESQNDISDDLKSIQNRG